MSAKTDSLMAQQAAARAPDQTNSRFADCLLCRVLWPTIVAHRHLARSDSSEAITLFLTNARSPHHHSPRY